MAATWVLLFGTFVAGIHAQDTWKIIPKMDNGPSHDIMTAPTSDIDTLKELCLSMDYCAGFSTAFSTLKFDLEDLGEQDNTMLYVRVPSPPPLPPPPPFNVWPMPAQLTYGDGSVNVTLNAKTFAVIAVGVQSERLSNAIARYSTLIFPVPPGSNATSSGATRRAAALRSRAGSKPSARASPIYLPGLNVDVKTADAALAFGMDESYAIDIPANGQAATLTANTVWGAIRGLETFSQLVQVDWSLNYWVPSVPISIQDAPRFPYRGLMMDTGRHFDPIQAIEDIIDLMSMSKFNVFHWHISDGQSFPFESEVYPLLWQDGSFDPVRAVFSKEDVVGLVEYAADRGIRVIPEFDIPGHADSWMVGYPQLRGSSTCNVMDPTLESTYAFLDKFIGEIVSVFPDQVLHFGGDEVQFLCWNESAAIRAFMQDHGMKTFGDIEGYWVSRLNAIVQSYNRTLMMWNDMWTNGATIPRGVNIELWSTNYELVANLTAAGLPTVFAGEFYLDTNQNWDQFYATLFVDPAWPPNPLYIGAEVPMWGEYVDEANTQQTAFPRAAAIGELFWSPDAVPKIAQYQAHRLEGWRCRMRARGYNVSPCGTFLNTTLYCNPL